MVWRSVQVERPRRAMSGGQSGVVVGRGEGVEEEEGGMVWAVMAAQSAKEVQERQLGEGAC